MDPFIFLWWDVEVHYGIDFKAHINVFIHRVT